MTQLDLIEYSKAKQARDAAIATVTENASEWIGIAENAFERLRWQFKGQEMTGEAIRLELEPSIGKPHHPNAFGAFILKLVRAKKLIPTGKLAPMTSEKSHSRRTLLYEIS